MARNKTYSVPSKRFKEKFDKIFNKDTNPRGVIKAYNSENLREMLLKFRQAPLPLYRDSYNSYVPVWKEKFSREFNSERNERIENILNQARKNGFDFSVRDYQILLERTGSQSELTLSELILRGLFIHPLFFKAYFKRHLLLPTAGKFKDNYYKRLFQAESVDDMINLLVPSWW